MIRINLLPYRAARRQRQILEHLGIAAGTIIVAILISLVGHWYTSSVISNLEEEYANLKMQNAILMKKIGKIRNLDKLRADVERKLKIVDTLQQGRFRSLITFYELSKAIPENVWLTSVEDTGAEIKLKGLGESNKAVANFMRMLDQSPEFANIRLMIISRKKLGELSLREFDLVLSRENQATTGKTTAGSTTRGKAS